MTRAQRQHAIDKLGPGLSDSIENRVTATRIGFQRMLRADAVAKLDMMFVTRASAICEIGSLGKKRAEDAMLHVKHRHVLMDCDLKPLRRSGPQQGFELSDVHVVRGCHSLQGETTHEIVRSKWIRHIQREITDAPA